MEWTPELEETVRSGRTRSSYGSSCCFIRLTDGMGLKLYGTKLERDASYVALSHASDYGFAPKVGQCVELSDMELPARQRPSWWRSGFKPKMLFGFLTEIADPIHSDDEDFSYEKDDLKSALDNLFDCYIEDLWGGNLGRLEDGTLVAIDLDGRFTGLLTNQDIRDINKEWGGGGFW